jgi:hypothetical protein
MRAGLRRKGQMLRGHMLAGMTRRAIRHRRMRILMRDIRGITIRIRRFILAGITVGIMGGGIAGELPVTARQKQSSDNFSNCADMGRSGAAPLHFFGAIVRCG